MRVVSGEHDLFDQFDLVVDQDAEPVDLDQVLAEFLLNYVRQQVIAGDTSDADDLTNSPEARSMSHE